MAMSTVSPFWNNSLSDGVSPNRPQMDVDGIALSEHLPRQFPSSQRFRQRSSSRSKEHSNTQRIMMRSLLESIPAVEAPNRSVHSSSQMDSLSIADSQDYDGVSDLPSKVGWPQNRMQSSSLSQPSNSNDNDGMRTFAQGPPIAVSHNGRVSPKTVDDLFAIPLTTNPPISSPSMPSSSHSTSTPTPIESDQLLELDALRVSTTTSIRTATSPAISGKAIGSFPHSQMDLSSHVLLPHSKFLQSMKTGSFAPSPPPAVICASPTPTPTPTPTTTTNTETTPVRSKPSSQDSPLSFLKQRKRAMTQSKFLIGEDGKIVMKSPKKMKKEGGTPSRLPLGSGTPQAPEDIQSASSTLMALVRASSSQPQPISSSGSSSSSTSTTRTKTRSQGASSSSSSQPILSSFSSSSASGVPIRRADRSTYVVFAYPRAKRMKQYLINSAISKSSERCNSDEDEEDVRMESEFGRERGSKETDRERQSSQLQFLSSSVLSSSKGKSSRCSISRSSRSISKPRTKSKFPSVKSPIAKWKPPPRRRTSSRSRSSSSSSTTTTSSSTSHLPVPPSLSQPSSPSMSSFMKLARVASDSSSE